MNRSNSKNNSPNKTLMFTNMKSVIFLSLVSGLIFFSPQSGNAQDFDDIYYNPAKEKKEEKLIKTKKVTKKTTTIYKTNENSVSSVVDYPAADTYTLNTGLNIDVDEYNRQGNYKNSEPSDTVTETDNFTYTRRIEKFHNPDVIVNTNDAELIEYYYETEPASPTVVNIYVDNTPLWAWSRPFYYNSWSWAPYYNSFWYNWSWNFYDPWYSWTWGPSWSWSWGGPWRPNPGWGWGWGPRPGGWGPPPGGWAHTWHPRPTSPGSSRPHNWAATPGAANPGRNNTGTRPGSTSHVGSLSGKGATAERPGSIARGRYSNAGTNLNNGNSRWPSSLNNGNSQPKGNTGIGNSTRPATVTPSGNTNSNRGKTASTVNKGTTTTPNNSGYNSSRNNSGNNTSRGSFGSGASTSRSSGGFGGSAGRTSTGGGGRGRR